MTRSILGLLLTASLLTGCLGIFPGYGYPDVVFGTVADTAVRKGQLDNGLTYFIRRNAEPRARAELRLVVNAGSILEDEDQLGLAHFVEHMAFNGTRRFQRQEIVDYLESIGMRFGPDVNAYTSFDETVYMLTVPTDSDETWHHGVEILREWATEIAFDSTEVDRERGVVIEEWRLGRGAGSRVQYRQFPTIANRSRYVERLPIGTLESLEGFEHSALVRFYEDWYRPDLMAIVVVGDVDVDEAEALIRDRFGDIPVPESPRQRREYPIPGHSETLISIASDPELTTSSVSLYFKRRPEEWTRVADYRGWLAEGLASAMLVNRLNEIAQRRDAPLLDVSSYQGRFVRTLTTFGITARTPDEDISEGLQVILLEIERASRFGFTRSELDREKREMRRVARQRFTERNRMTSASYAADYVSYYLYGGSVLGQETEYLLQDELLERIGTREVNQVVRQWTQPANRVMLASAPEREGVVPPTEAFLRLVVDMAHLQTLQPYQDRESEAPLLRETPRRGRIVEETELPAIGGYVWRLDNGARVVLKPTDFRQDEVLFAARSPGGTSLVPDEDYIAALTAAAVVQSGGLGELSANDLRKRLTGRVAGVGADIGELYEGLSGAASTADLETLFQLAYLRFTAPRPDTAAFLAYQSQARASLSNRLASPENAFVDTLRVTLSQGHPRAMPPSVEMFGLLNMERSFEIYRDRFADASDFTFFFVGSVSIEEMRPLVETYLASLPSLGRVEAGRDVGIRPPTGVVRKVVRRGIEPRATTQLVFTGPIDFERDNIIAVQGLAEILSLRLRERLREDLGGTYGVEVRGNAARDPLPRFQFSIAFGSAPDRVDELVDEVFAEIERLAAEGPTPDDLGKVREMQFRSRETSLRQNQFWLAQLINYDQYGWDLEELATIATRFESVGPEVIQDAARTYLSGENYVQVSLLPSVQSAARSVEP